jgi:hypothetical protein
MSVSPKTEDPAFRNVTFDELKEAYKVRIRMHVCVYMYVCA